MEIDYFCKRNSWLLNATSARDWFLVGVGSWCGGFEKLGQVRCALTRIYTTCTHAKRRAYSARRRSGDVIAYSPPQLVRSVKRSDVTAITVSTPCRQRNKICCFRWKFRHWRWRWIVVTLVVPARFERSILVKPKAHTASGNEPRPPTNP